MSRNPITLSTNPCNPVHLAAPHLQIWSWKALLRKYLHRFCGAKRFSGSLDLVGLIFSPRASIKDYKIIQICIYKWITSDGSDQHMNSSRSCDPDLGVGQRSSSSDPSPPGCRNRSDSVQTNGKQLRCESESFADINCCLMSLGNLELLERKIINVICCFFESLLPLWNNKRGF